MYTIRMQKLFSIFAGLGAGNFWAQANFASKVSDSIGLVVVIIYVIVLALSGLIVYLTKAERQKFKDTPEQKEEKG